MYALSHTHQLQVERERDIEPIKCMRSPHTTATVRGERDIEPISVCAHHTPATGGGGVRGSRANQVCMRSHTPATGGEEERDLEPIKCMLTTHSKVK